METEKSLMIVFESHLNNRFELIAKKNKMDCYFLNGDNNLKSNRFLNIVLRVINIFHLFKKIDQMCCYIEDNIDSDYIIYVSNSEGYVAANALSVLRKKFPNLEIRALQHGLMGVPEITFRKKAIWLINDFIYFFVNFYSVGFGFGYRLTNKYIVYSEEYKSYLVNEFNWNENDVIVDLKFLKSDLNFDKAGSVAENNKCDKSVVFFMQCLSLGGICNKNREFILINKAISFLYDHYDKVYVKAHPACAELLDVIQNKDVLVVDDLFSCFSLANHAYSFTSTTLLDAKLFGLTVFSFYASDILLKEDKVIYAMFDGSFNLD